MSQRSIANVSVEQARPTGDSRSPEVPWILKLIWERKLLVLLGLVIGVVLGSLYYAQSTPVFQSAAQILVVKKSASGGLPIGGADPRSAYYDDFLATHLVLMRSPVIVAGAVDKGKLKQLSSFGGGDPTGAIIANLEVSRDSKTVFGGSNIITLSYRSGEPSDCRVVIDAVIDSYKRFLDATYKNVNDDTVKFITQARDVLETKIVTREKEYREFRLRFPVLWKGKDGLNVHQERILQIETKRSGLLVRQAEIGGLLKVLKNEGAKHNSKDIIAMVARTARSMGIEKDTNIVGDDPLLTLQLQEKMLMEDFGPDHPEVKSIRTRVDWLRSNSRLLQDLGSKQSESDDPVQAYGELLKHELATLQMSELSLAEMGKEEEERANKLITYEIQDDAFRKDVARNQQLFDVVVARLQEINLLKEFGGYVVQTISPPGSGGKVAPRAVPIFFMAVFFGLAGGVGLAWLAAISDKGFRTPEEVRRRLGLPIVGHIPNFVAPKGAPQDPTAPDISLCTLHRPKSIESESYRAVRTALFFSCRNGENKIVQVTSPTQGDGKSTLAANLAISVAQSQKRVLLIDADFRRPRLHRLFRISSEVGLASVVSGAAELAGVIQSSTVPGLSLLPCGPIPSNPAELLTLPRFQEVLAELRNQYDFVIVDTPPLLAVTDPSIVLPYVDGVFLTIRLSKQARPSAERAKEILASQDANVFGVVVNGVERHGGGYYYSGGYYAYGGDGNEGYFAGPKQ